MIDLFPMHVTGYTILSGFVTHSSLLFLSSLYPFLWSLSSFTHLFIDIPVRTFIHSSNHSLSVYTNAHSICQIPLHSGIYLFNSISFITFSSIFPSSHSSMLLYLHLSSIYHFVRHLLHHLSTVIFVHKDFIIIHFVYINPFLFLFFSFISCLRTFGFFFF